MLFRVLFTGVFTGTIGATAAFSLGLGVFPAFAAYVLFGALAVIGLGVLVLASPQRPTPSRQWPSSKSRVDRTTHVWHPLSINRRAPYWQERLERMARQTIGAQAKPAAVCVFTSVRRDQPDF
ncbi:hypothetical protein SAMN04488030_1855 [Aliiroseovarius halocynthiae]|uniref:Uncharacterized protein n=1 Tax=Aliiroseovarius halocynthiae TaxID=985055 RepID=A0A545SQZ4_9RHOB|nr:hypothetical protein [Aliiroseovarius halocynthiae]TQV67387.1 hypothetical protein FIL88_09150 [Aliiroseovarius halocynthiae]SMR81334.1 hypothetical protein SAMN04488030_1855 [Aliiroseovarius halocynthiae]